jgi:hypothetical protein
MRRVSSRIGWSGYGKDMSIYSIEDYRIVKHVMARIDE